MHTALTGVERIFGEDEIIVSKTDTTGRIIYANEVFQRISGYGEEELLGRPHSIIRHPDMPRCVFKVLWDTITAGDEVFAYVNNRARNGDHYWVLAHITPSRDAAGTVVSYHSSRRRPRREAVAKAAQLYAELAAIEAAQADRKAGLAASTRTLTDRLRAAGLRYDEFVLTL